MCCTTTKKRKNTVYINMNKNLIKKTCICYKKNISKLFISFSKQKILFSLKIPFIILRMIVLYPFWTVPGNLFVKQGIGISMDGLFLHFESKYIKQLISPGSD